MKISKRETTTFNGLGFPVILVDAPYTMTAYGETLDVDFNKLQELVFEALVRKPGRLAGAEVKFIRQMFDISQKVFADLLGVERSLVAKWEKKDLEGTGMAPSTEVLLRIRIANQLRRSLDKEFPFIEPATRKTEVGEPLQLAV